MAITRLAEFFYGFSCPLQQVCLMLIWMGVIIRKCRAREHWPDGSFPFFIATWTPWYIQSQYIHSITLQNNMQGCILIDSFKMKTQERPCEFLMQKHCTKREQSGLETQSIFTKYFHCLKFLFIIGIMNIILIGSKIEMRIVLHIIFE